MWRTVLMVCIMLVLGIPNSGDAQPTQLEKLETVSLQLKWQAQFQSAGFIMAKEKGFYAASGLDVVIHERQPKMDNIAAVLSHKATYSIYNSPLIIANRKIQPIVLLATYLHRSPLVFATQKGLTRPYDLIGKTIMLSTKTDHFGPLTSLLHHFAVTRKNSTIIKNTSTLDRFIAGEVDAVPVFTSDQLFTLQQRQIPFDVIDPYDYGFNIGALNLFTSQQEVNEHPERTKKFITASNRGWQYALEHIDETVQLIHNKYAPDKSIAALTYEAKNIKQLFQRQKYPIGYINNKLTLNLYRRAMDLGILNADQDLDFYLFNNLAANKSSTIKFTPTELEYLRKKQQITMGADPNWMPFEKIKDGKHYGIAADFFALFQQQLPIPIVLVPTKSWQETIEKTMARECDILSLAAPSASRRKYLNFTSPYMTIPVVIATTIDKIYINDIGRIGNKPLGAVRGYAINEEMRNTYPDLNIVDVDSIDDGLKQVENGRLYGYIDNVMTIADQIQKKYTGSIKISGRLEGVAQVNLSVATRNDEPELQTIFDKLVHSVSPVQKQAIFNKWTTVTTASEIDYNLFWSLLGAFCFVSILFGTYFHQLRKYNSLLLKLSETDKLTGLYNRCKLDALLNEKYELFLRYETNCGVAILDIDYFKKINDTFGHQTGDSVLKELALLMKQNIRSTDTVGRWGGEEFLILASNSDSAETIRLAEKLLQALRTHQFAEAGTVTASCGISSLVEGQNIKDTLRLADKAMYVAKGNGRDQVVCASQLESTTKTELI